MKLFSAMSQNAELLIKNHFSELKIYNEIVKALKQGAAKMYGIFTLLRLMGFGFSGMGFIVVMLLKLFKK